MESHNFAKHIAHNTKLRLCPGSSSIHDPEFLDLLNPMASQEQSNLKLKKSKVVPHDLVEINKDPAGFLIIGGKDSAGKQSEATMIFNKNWENQVQDGLAKDPMSSKTDLELDSGASMDPLSSFGAGSEDLSYLDDYYEDENEEDNEDVNKDDSGLMEMDEDFEVNMDAQFDNIDLAPGVEGFIPWLEEPTKSVAPKSGNLALGTSFRHASYSKPTGLIEDEIMKKFRQFKQFDTVSDYSDHYYAQPNCKSHKSTGGSVQGISLTAKAPKEWTKKIQSEWKTLENGLPGKRLGLGCILNFLTPKDVETVAFDRDCWIANSNSCTESIFVRAYEERTDFLRAVIVGPAETPYHDGLFFFDIFFPESYPSEPPLVHYHSGGLRLNPNLYASGKVCLSLLNTWSGSKSEMWTPGKSTILQVLVSIQALVLNAKPYFNEPGYKMSAGTADGERQSLAYNEDTFLLSCKTMVYTLNRPPKHFEDFVAGHFYQRAHAVLDACKAYMNGAQVGFPSDAAFPDKSHSSRFNANLDELFKKLVVAFTENGADCQQFLDQTGKGENRTVLKLCPQNLQL